MATIQPSSIEENEITLGTGMGLLRFGATMDEVRTLVGEPEEIEESEDEDEFEHQEWVYHEEEYLVSLYFDREDDFRLSCIETDNPNMRLFGEAVHGQPLEMVKALMHRNGLADAEVENMDGGEVRLSYEQSMIDLYFDEGVLQFVNFGVFINDELEVQWPK